MPTGKSVRLFLAEGTPGGLTTAEIMNWTGHVVSASRADLKLLLDRDESRRTGIYMLLGDDPDGTGGMAVYIGEGDDISTRLRQHAQPSDKGGKDFWDQVVILTSKDANLTKAHARYLESRFIALAAEARRAKMVNGTAPAPLPLPESDISDMEYYIEQALIVLPVLGINVLRPVKRTSTVPKAAAVEEAPTSDSPTFIVTTRKDPRLRATARAVDGEFIVDEGSFTTPSWAGKVSSTYTALREQLEADGTLVLTEDGRHRRFTRDYPFASPSAAAATVLGRSSNGRIEWKTATGLNFGSWETGELTD